MQSRDWTCIQHSQMYSFSTYINASAHGSILSLPITLPPLNHTKLIVSHLNVALRLFLRRVFGLLLRHLLICVGARGALLPLAVLTSLSPSSAVRMSTCVPILIAVVRVLCPTSVVLRIGV